MKNILGFLFFFACFISIGQDLSQSYLDKLEDEELLSLFDESYRDSIRQEKIARSYLDRARREGDTIKMARGYDRLARIFHPEKNIAFADSVIKLTEHHENITYPALGYLIKGFEYNRTGDLVNATKNFHIAYEYSLINDNITHQLYALHFLIDSKSFWGDELGALELQKRRHKLILSDDYFVKIRESSREGYLDNIENLAKEDEIISIYGFVFCYINLKDFEEAQKYINLLALKVKNYEGTQKERFNQFSLECQLELDYYLGNFEEVRSIGDSLSQLQIASGGLSGLFDNYGFNGLSSIEQGKIEEGIHYLKKADSIYSNTLQSILPYRRRVFKELLDYYRSKNDDSMQIEYLNKLIKIDSVFKINYQYFEPEYIKRIETPKLLEAKESLIAGLEGKNQKFKKANWWIAGFLTVSSLLMIYYFNRQLVYKKRFEALLTNNSTNVKRLAKKGEKLEISKEVVEDIMYKLERFERQREYLSPDLSLQELAKKFHTNSNYLSRVVNLKMEKNFSQYIHDLRIEYSMEAVLSKPKFRKYTIKAIAEECGYTNAESFARAFYKKNGIYPSYYIKKINKSAI